MPLQGGGFGGQELQTSSKLCGTCHDSIIPWLAFVTISRKLRFLTSRSRTVQVVRLAYKSHLPSSNGSHNSRHGDARH
jgi:hypothetical protein